ncbi:3-oxoadipate enol-lactonase [Humitalea rosea]|uniref:3-oxoadipate enol-lactonase n=1 Tax=Humitalea rosea TaxID=990373 RepID=A0A2W7IMI3_9PROT|nr:alpha/beta hydrolase [Humitalea rosea]PZW48045.1 3-oxoadipate enol-lactonase [Humitalea rosea]
MTALLHHQIHRHPSSHGPVLLLIHPLGAAHDFWDACLPGWTPHVGCLAVDLRSAGRSPGDGAPPGLDRHVEDLEALRASLGLARLIPIGCAVGSMVAAAYAARYPSRVAGLVLSNPTPRSAESSRAMLLARADAVRAGGMGAILPGAVERPFEAQPRDARYAHYLAAFATQDAGAYADAVTGFATADASADLPLVRCPVLLLAGRHDLLLPLLQAEAVRDLLPPGARLEVDEAGAHFLPYQRPDAFARRVMDFLATLPERSDP